MSLPKIFCITLKNTPNRTSYAENHFKKNKLDVTFFEGINAKNFGLTTVIPYMDDIYFNHPNWKPGDSPMHFISQGQLGCLLSHFALWKTISYLPYDEYIIFEDDVVLYDNFIEKFIDYKSRLPQDWQYVFLGRSCLDNLTIKSHNENIISTKFPPLGTFAYMIKKNLLSTLIESNSVAWTAVDIQIQKRTLMANNINYYIFDPPLATEISGNQPDHPYIKSTM